MNDDKRQAYLNSLEACSVCGWILDFGQCGCAKGKPGKIVLYGELVSLEVGDETC